MLLSTNSVPGVDVVIDSGLDAGLGAALDVAQDAGLDDGIAAFPVRARAHPPICEARDSLRRCPAC